ncbi:hypothetical protein Taro_007957 [Colocasia esculenta]|uniref:Methyltransferase type 11 domain-containing protein n=1 Tax=Colocasia esculenta TaxID=4460 RepID=A0A843U130_COLES|nr:hypothetical protein [Colocasia esculenta]
MAPPRTRPKEQWSSHSTPNPAGSKVGDARHKGGDLLREPWRDSFDKQADHYADARPSYPVAWFAKFASLTTHHASAWDAGTGNGQAAVSVSFSFFHPLPPIPAISITTCPLSRGRDGVAQVAEHYERVVATDISEAQLARATPHPRARYVHVPASIHEDDLVALLGGEGSIDLVTVSQAVHWFDLPGFYAVVDRVLRKPGGVIAVWGYRRMRVCPTFDAALHKFFSTTIPYWETHINYIKEEYRNLPFPFEGVGVGREGEPASLEMKKEASFEGLLGVLQSWSAVNTARERGAELLGEEAVAELAAAWAGASW